MKTSNKALVIGQCAGVIGEVFHGEQQRDFADVDPVVIRQR